MVNFRGIRVIHREQWSLFETNSDKRNITYQWISVFNALLFVRKLEPDQARNEGKKQVLEQMMHKYIVKRPIFFHRTDEILT